MNKGGHVASVGGFTIVETMIVLAVSSMLFVIAATMISGRQAKTEFQVGSRDIQTKIQQIINETKSGYYGSDGTTCSAGGSGPLTIGSNSGNLGKTGDCIFIGRAFVISGETLVVYPLAGIRQFAGVDVTKPVDARATAIPNAVENYNLPYGMKFVSLDVDGTTYTGGTRGFSILTSFSSTTNLGGQTFNIHKFSNTFTDLANAENGVNGELTAPSPYQLASSVSICLQSGTTNQSLKVIIGGDNSTTLRTEVKGNTTCAG